MRPVCTAQREKGTTLIELLVALFVMGLIMASMISLFLAAGEILSGNKARAGALTLAQDRLEYLRSLSYREVGTVGGIPAGVASGTEVLVLNDTRYTVRTLIQYVDDDADGLGGGDTTGVTADYKRAKVEVSWFDRGATSSLTLVSSVVPVGIENLDGGGTLRLAVIDSVGLPVEGATVAILNNTIATSVDTFALTTAAGEVIFPGAPVGSGYQVSVSKAGYSTDGTYSVTGENPNPQPGHLSVADAATTPGTFIIDATSQLTVVTREPIDSASTTDTFLDTSGLLSLEATTVTGGYLAASSSGSTYPAAATATSLTIAPAGLVAWGEVDVAKSEPASTSVRVQVLSDASGSFEPVSDALVPGNGQGLLSVPIDLSALDPAVHTQLRLRARFASEDPNETALLDAWSVSYDAGFVPIPNVAFSIRGEHDIGLKGISPVYYFAASSTTDGSGEVVFGDVRFDAYTIQLDPAEGYDVAEYCDSNPVTVPAGSEVTRALSLVPDTAHTARVVVVDDANAPVSDATVELTRPGFSETQLTTSCGQAFFSGLANAADYDLTVTHPSHPPQTLLTQSVSGDVRFDIALP